MYVLLKATLSSNSTYMTAPTRITNQLISRQTTPTSLLLSLIKLVHRTLLLEYTYSLIDHILLFANPFFINRILTAIQSTNKQTDISKAVGWVIALLFSSLARSACEAQLYWLNRKVDVELRGAICSALYVKSLRMAVVGGGRNVDGGDARGKGSGVKGKTKSQVATLYAVDTEKILHAFRLSHYALFVPLLIAACMVLLIRMLGWAALFGLGALSLAAPLTIVCGKWVKAMRKSVLEKMDARLTQLGEVSLLSGR